MQRTTLVKPTDRRGELLGELRRLERGGKRFDRAVWDFARFGDLRVFDGLPASEAALALVNSPLVLKELVRFLNDQSGDAINERTERG